MKLNVAFASVLALAGLAPVASFAGGALTADIPISDTGKNQPVAPTKPGTPTPNDAAINTTRSNVKPEPAAQGVGTNPTANPQLEDRRTGFPLGVPVSK